MSASWIRDAARGLRDEVEVELREQPGQPDLADVLARARALDAESVPESLHARDLEASEAADLPAPALDVFTHALRDEIESDASERAMQPTRPPGYRRASGLIVGAIAAAVVLLAFAVGTGAVQQVEPSEPVQASKSAHEEDQTQWQQRERRPVTPTPSPAAAPENPEPAATLPEPPPREARQPSLDALERRAMAAWRAGDLPRAERLLRRIIARAGRGPKAELAYGDLFALTKQRGGPAGQRKAWKQYLRRFPRGQHAEDARAGLCMHASGDASRRCWSDYLSAHPNGAHVRRARRELE